MRFDEQVVIVTGAAQGIGRAVAERFAAEGAVAVVVDRDAEAGHATVGEIAETGAKAAFIEADVASRKQIDAAVAEVMGRYGKIDALVNNAAITNHSHFLDVTDDEFDNVLSVNLKSQYRFGQSVARAMIEKGTRGAIVNVSSITSALGVPTQAAYASSKGAINSLTRVMAIALAEHGIRVNAVAPGTIATPMVSRSFAELPELKNKLLARTPLQRFGDPSEMASVVAFLASEDASYVTGQVLFADGGRLALAYTVAVPEE